MYIHIIALSSIKSDAKISFPTFAGKWREAYKKLPLPSPQSTLTPAFPVTFHSTRYTSKSPRRQQTTIFTHKPPTAAQDLDHELRTQLNHHTRIDITINRFSFLSIARTKGHPFAGNTIFG